MISLVTIFINIIFVNKYYIYEKKKILNSVANELELVNINENFIKKLEEDNEVTIAYTLISDDIESLNEELIFQFNKKKIKLNKFWITEETLDMLNQRNINKLYDQGASKYKVLAKFLKIDNYIYAIGMPLPYMDETISTINKFNLFIMLISIISIVLLVSLLSQKIVKPLENLKDLSKDIALLHFKRIDIKTNDEIEELALSINNMSESLEKAHNEINSQNKRLKQLLSDVSHELKTPLALIKIYTQGIEDGLDDGTYSNIVQDQIERINTLIEKLLFWAKLDNSKLNECKFSLKNLVESTINKYKLILKQSDISLIYDVDKKMNFEVYADKEMIQIVLDNLITNAIKYTNDKEISVELKHHYSKVKLIIANGIKKEHISNLDELWTPFYVAEKSRNKNLSGTGLGLAIVQSVLEKHKLTYGFEIVNNKIEFFIEFL